MKYDVSKNITRPKMTQYEKALVLGKRATQISSGAKPNITVKVGMTVVEIATEELRQKKVPFIIKRPIKEKAGFLWPLLKHDFKLSFFGSFGLNNIASYYLTERALATLPKNCQGIYLQENQCWEYGFAHLWKMRDLGRLFGFVHVPIAYWDLMFFHHRTTYLTRKSSNPDFSIVGSLSCLSLLERQNLPIKTLPLEALRYIGFGEGRQSILLHKTFRPNNHRKVLLTLYLQFVY